MGNVPNLRFPEFSGEWKKFSIEKLCDEFKSGKNIKADNILVDGAYPVYGGNGLRGFTDSYNHDGDYVLIGRQGALCGNVRFVTGKTHITEHAIAVQANKNNNTRFLEYLFVRLNLGQFSDQSAQPGLAVNKLLRIETFVPTVSEQKRIVQLLQVIDERIATQTKIIEKLQSLISGLNDFIHLQVGGLSTSFEELGTSYSGLSGKSGDDFGKGKPYITYLNIYSNSIVNEEQVDYVVIGDNEKQNTLLYGDLLFTLSSETPDEVGIGAVYLGESDKYYLNSFCFGLHMTATNKVYSPYLAYLVSNNVFRKFIYPLAQGSTRFNLQKNDFMKKKFLLPTFESQKEIARTLNALSSKLETERKLLLNYQEQKQYLLGSMFI